ncbi:MAG: hypothetical protein KGL39_49675, partial [Patescibacteria group bacterium]|nr:hypothetical protein [Patescibacteria group bacterium]
LGTLAGGVDVGAFLHPIEQAAPGMVPWVTAKVKKMAEQGLVFTGVGEAQNWLTSEIDKDFDPKSKYVLDAKRLLGEGLAGAILGFFGHTPLKEQPAPTPPPPGAAVEPPPPGGNGPSGPSGPPGAGIVIENGPQPSAPPAGPSGGGPADEIRRYAEQNIPTLLGKPASRETPQEAQNAPIPPVETSRAAGEPAVSAAPAEFVPGRPVGGGGEEPAGPRPAVGAEAPPIGAGPKRTVPEILADPELHDTLNNPEIIRKYDVPYLAGSSDEGGVTYIDKRVPEQITLPQADGQGEVTFDPAEALHVHEQVEHALMEDGHPYAGAHEIATGAERAKVQEIGADWQAYQNAMLGMAKGVTEKEKPTNPPPDLYTKPYPHQEAEFLQRKGQQTQAFGAEPIQVPAGPTPTTPEPASDIRAPIAAMADPDHPKDSVFVAAGNEGAIPENLPPGVRKVSRTEGTLLTTDSAKADEYKAAGEITDIQLARLLGYPEPKAAALASGTPVAVQAKDAEGNVIQEMVSSPQGLPAAVAAARQQTPEGGQVAVVSPIEAQARRAAPPTMEYAETTHTKTGAPLFVAKLIGERLPADRFAALQSKAKQAGGHWSSFRGKGAIPGFQFKTKDAAEKFIAEHGGGQATPQTAPAAPVIRTPPKEVPGYDPSRIFEKGQRVIVADGPLAGRHGEVTKHNALVMQSLFGGHRSESHSYDVKTDGGHEIITSRLVAEPGRPSEPVVKDPVIEGHPIAPEMLEARIGSLRSSVARFRGMAERAKKQDRIRQWRDEAATAQKKVTDYQKVLDDWKARGPEAVAPERVAETPISTKEKWREVGKNADGKTLYEDDRGVRSIVENGVRRAEPVQMRPTREGMQVATDRVAHPEYEIASEAVKKEAAPEKPKTPEAPTPPVALRQPGTEIPAHGVLLDLTAALRDYAGTRSVPREVNQAVADFVVERGRNTDHENVGVFDGSTGEIIEASTSSLPDEVNLSHSFVERAEDPNAQLIVHHNHPRGMGLSDNDAAILGYPGIRWIVAHGHDGQISAMSLTHAARTIFDRYSASEATQVIRDIHEKAADAAVLESARFIASGSLTREDADILVHEAVNRGLSEAGLTHYLSSVGFDIPKGIQNDVTHAAARGATEEANKHGFKAAPTGALSHYSADPGTWRVRPAEAMARILGASHEIAEPGSPAIPERNPVGAEESRSGSEVPAGRPNEGLKLSERMRTGPTAAEEEHTRGLIDRLAAPIKAFLRTDPVQKVVNGKTVADARDALGKFSDDIVMKVNPGAIGADAAKAAAKDFANEERRIGYHLAQIDKMIVKKYSPQERAKMGQALDEQSVMDQEHVTDPDRGLGRLTEDQRALVELLDNMSQRTWQGLVDAGIVQGEGLPHYMPRYFVNVIGPKGEISRIGEGNGVSSLDPLGSNLRTAGPGFRKHLTAEETEAAAKAKLGDNATLVTDIRALLASQQRSQRAIAGRNLISAVKEIGKKAGVETVSEDMKPGFFTVDHPAFTEIRPAFTMDEDGKVVPRLDSEGNIIFAKRPIYVSREFEGPLRSVLTKPSGALYNAMMQIKSASVGLIMISPMTHNMVIYGKAFSSMPGKMITLKLYRDGFQVRKDPQMMDKLISAGMVPINQGWMQDILGIAQDVGA